MPNLALLVDGVVVQRFTLERPLTRVGRSPANDIQLDDLSVSSAHALVEGRPSRYLEGSFEYQVVDLGSTNGTFVNGTRVERQALIHGDEVRLGYTVFKYQEEAAPLSSTAYMLSEEQD